MRTITTSNGFTVKVSDCDFDSVSKYRWCAIKNGHTYYVRAWINKKRTPIHRFLLGVDDPKKVVDHIDRDALNNCRENLRVCTHAENQMNRIASGKCKYKGVSLHTSKKHVILKNGAVRVYSYTKFMAYITLNGKMKNLGRFNTEIEAAKAYNDNAPKYFGEFARLNVI
jgi:hypothetical protein